jgi:hypothetical protein
MGVPNITARHRRVMNACHQQTEHRRSLGPMTFDDGGYSGPHSDEVIQLVTMSGHYYTIHADSSIGYGCDLPPEEQAFVGISQHHWSRRPNHTLADCQECPSLMTGAYLWTTNGRWTDRIRSAWRESVLSEE